MPSVAIEATAVAFRRGNEDEVRVFKGVQGEMVVDLTNKTLVMCDGVKRGGYPMARADFSNINTSSLATGDESTDTHAGKNLAYYDFSNCDTAKLAEGGTIAGKSLAYNDLTNLAHNLSEESKVNVSQILKADYNLAATNAKNVNTTYLAEGTDETRDPATLGKNLAYADLSNLITNTDAENKVAVSTILKSDYQLAALDMSNVNTADLATGAGEEGKHAGKNLAYADFTNVNLGNTLSAYELIANKSNDFTVLDAVHYPTTTAVNTFVQSTAQTLRSELIKNDFSNVQDWERAYLPAQSFSAPVEITFAADVNRGEGYAVNDVVSLNVTTSTSEVQLIHINVTEVDENGAILNFTQDVNTLFNQTITSTDVTDPDTQKATPAVFTIATGTQTLFNGGNVLKSDLTNATEALNILKVTPEATQTTSFRLQLDHNTAQVYPIEIVGDPSALTITLDFIRGQVSANSPVAYVYEVHISVGSVLPNITWAVASEPGVTPPEIRWLQYVEGPTEPNKTALFVIRQQQGKIIANYAGSY